MDKPYFALRNDYKPPTFIEDFFDIVKKHRTKHEILEEALFVWDVNKFGECVYPKPFQPDMIIGPKQTVAKGTIRTRTISPCGPGKVRISDCDHRTWETITTIQMRPWRSFVDKICKALIRLQDLWVIPVGSLVRRLRPL